MKGINKAIIIGRIGANPEVKVTDTGLSIVKFPVATNRKYKDTEETTWHKIVAFGKAGEIIARYQKKGDIIYIEGRINNNTYLKGDGSKGYSSEIVCDEFSFLGGAEAKPGEQRTASEARGDLKAISEGLKANGIENELEDEPNDDIPGW